MLRARIKELFTLSRNSAGSRTIMAMLADLGIKAGLFKIRRVMKVMQLICT
ncbi:IS3 family transposase [Pseudoalteromonas sp. PPB1]|uniref:IS3 family transposase n=1 Tax=Pseudoalteromonas sp. PPB1 TaxID=2756136 RepID=UPI003A5BA552